MFDRVLPRRIDNTFHGHVLALWLFGLVLFLKTGIALGSIFNGRNAAQNADGIPLDTFGASGAEAVLVLFALWGIAQLGFSVLGVLALARYRAMIPFLFILFLLEHAVRRGVLLSRPIATDGNPLGLYINLALLALIMVGVVLSLRQRRDMDGSGG